MFSPVNDLQLFPRRFPNAREAKGKPWGIEGETTNIINRWNTKALFAKQQDYGIPYLNSPDAVAHHTRDRRQSHRVLRKKLSVT